jgi:membrane-associated HD superfamily phosphohydrolase
MAAAIGCDVNLVKNCAYYHRIKHAYSYSDEEFQGFLSSNQFPPEASALLTEYLAREGKPLSKEAGIVYISDKLIATLMSLFEKDKKIKIDYKELIETLIDKNMFKSNMADCDLSIKDYNAIKDILLKETLYYDFLR